MILKLDMSGDIPIYVQLRNQIVLGIGKKKIVGERLPTVRQLAGDAGINTMTVNKAYQVLKAEGLLRLTDGMELWCGRYRVRTAYSMRSWKRNWSY